MPNNIPVSTLSASLSLDVAGFAAGVKQAESLSRRLAKAQAEALGGPGLRSAAESLFGAIRREQENLGKSKKNPELFPDLERQVKRAQELRARAELQAQAARAAVMSPDGGGRFTPKVSELQGPIRLRQSQIDAEIASEMTKRVNAARERVQIERSAEEQATQVRRQAASEDALLADQMAAGREAAAQRRMQTERTLLAVQIESYNERKRQERVAMEAEEQAAEAAARIHEQKVAQERQLAAIRAKTLQTQEQSRFDNSNPFQQQVLASQKLVKLLQERRALQRGTVAFAEKELEVVRQIAAVRSIRAGLTASNVDLRNLGSTAADSQARFARFGLGMQQVGYQVQDFAVQVASGTSSMVALSQQGSQVLGFFGGFKGAIAGAVLSVGILAYRLTSVSERNKEVAKSLEEVSKGYAQLGKEQAAFARQVSAPREQSSALEAEERSFRAASKLAEIRRREEKERLDSSGGIVTETGRSLRDSLGAQTMGVLALKTTTNLLTKIIGGYGQASIAQKGLVKASEDGVEAERQRFEALREYRRLLDDLVSQRNTVLDTLRPDRVDEREDERLAALVAAGAVTREQVGQYRALADFSKARAASDWAAGKSNVAQLEALRRQAGYLRSRGLGKTEVASEIDKEIGATQRAAELEARAYLDQLEPLRAKRRELEKIRELQEAGFFGDRDVVSQFTARMQDEIRRSLKLPDVFSFSGAQSSGGTVSTQPNIQIDLTRKMLTELNKITDYTRMMAGVN